MYGILAFSYIIELKASFLYTLDPIYIQAEKARRSLRLFVRDAWPIIEPSTPFIDGWHLHAIEEHLTAVTQREITRLLVNMPPRHCKSTLISTLWPVWCWISDPSLRWLCSSYAMSLAIRDNRKCRLLIQSPWFQKRYGHVFQLSGDQNVKSRFENNARGYRLAVSVGAAATGEGGDILLIDDPHPIDDSTSDVARETTKQWFDETWVSRLNNQHNGAMVVVGQRIHYDDLSGHLIEQGDWIHLNLPTEYDPDRHCRTVLGWSDPRKEKNTLLWPERFSDDTVLRLKRQLGSRAYAAQYQQTPLPADGGQFKQSWFQYYREDEDGYFVLEPTGLRKRRVLMDDCSYFCTVDLAISSKQTADYTVIALWAVTPERDLILVDMIRDRLDNPAQQRAIESLYRREEPDYIKIESVAYQLSLIQQLRRRGLPIREYKPVKDKVSRASTASVYYEAGKVFHPKNATWLAQWEYELVTFPLSSHDDIVDVTSMAAEELGSPGRIGGMMVDFEETDTEEEVMSWQ